MQLAIKWIRHHPNLSAWFVLALGMVILLVLEARDVGLEASQWFWLIVVTILVAGACIWIVSWGDNDEIDGDEEAGDESVGNEDVGNEDVGNESVGNEMVQGETRA